jgi:hypothetical protein
MNRDERKKRLQDIIELNRQNAIKQEYEELATEFCDELLEKESINVLTVEQSEEIEDRFVEEFPFDSSGSVARIDWEKMSTKFQIDEAHHLFSFIKQGGFENSIVYLIRKTSSTFNQIPVISTTIENIIISFVNISYEEQFIYCPSEKYAIEVLWSGEIIAGW